MNNGSTESGVMPAHRFDEIDVWNIAIQMIKGIKALHDKRILHRDLKSANIFTYSDGTVKIGDLNVSKIMKEQLSYTQTGTPYYASPEVWRDKPYDFKSDIWSLGVIIYEVAMLVVPFKAETIEELYKKVCRGIYHPIPSTVFSKELSDLLKSMLNVDPQKRPTCNDILSIPYVQDKMKQLGFTRELALLGSDKVFQNEAFKPSTVHQILNPLN